MARTQDIPRARVKAAPAPDGARRDPQPGEGATRAEVVPLPELSPNRAYIWMGVAVLLSAVVMLGAGFYLW